MLARWQTDGDRDQLIWISGFDSSHGRSTPVWQPLSGRVTGREVLCIFYTE